MEGDDEPDPELAEVIDVAEFTLRIDEFLVGGGGGGPPAGTSGKGPREPFTLS